MIDKEKLFLRIKEGLAERKISQKELAGRLSVCQSTLHTAFDRNSIPFLLQGDRLEVIADMLGTTAENLLFNKDGPNMSEGIRPAASRKELAMQIEHDARLIEMEIFRRLTTIDSPESLEDYELVSLSEVIKNLATTLALIEQCEADRGRGSENVPINNYFPSDDF